MAWRRESFIEVALLQISIRLQRPTASSYALFFLDLTTRGQWAEESLKECEAVYN
jgi:hypothetical protein